MRGPDARRAVQRVVVGRRRERFRFQQGVRGGNVPVYGLVIRAGKLSQSLQEVALEVVCNIFNKPALVEGFPHHAAQITGFGIRCRFAIDSHADEFFRAAVFAQPLFHGATQSVVNAAQPVSAAVKSNRGLAIDSKQRLPFAGIHALRLAGHGEGVVGVGHHHAALRVLHGERVAQNVKHSERGVPAQRPVVRDAVERASLCVQILHGRRARVFRGEPCGPLFRICRLIPCRVWRVPVRVPAAFQHGIVLVETPLFPRGEFHPAERSVWQVRAHEPVERVVVQHGRDPGLDDGGLALVTIVPAEIRLVLLDGIARVVVDGAAGTDPADVRPAVLLDD